MKCKHSELTQRYLVLIKIDSENLCNRISNRRHEYVEIFSLKRNRGIFKDIFDNRYSKSTFSDLSNLPIEIIELSNEFYEEVDRLYWYLKHTQDMPNTIEDEITRRVSRISSQFENLKLYIDAELSGKEVGVDDFEQIPSDNQHYEHFALEGEIAIDDKEEDFLQDEVFSDEEEADQET